MPSKKTSSGTADAAAAKAPKPAKPGSRKRVAATAPPRRQASQQGRATGGRLRVKQVRSGIGHAYTYRRTLAALGLKHHQDEVVVPDTPSVRGMLFKVAHLVSVRPEEG
jgi:large subunit ribosomal protein L30